jgi:hypothetical protein
MEVQGLEFLLGACRRFRAVFNVGSWYYCNSVLYYCSLKGNCWQMLPVYLNWPCSWAFFLTVARTISLAPFGSINRQYHHTKGQLQRTTWTSWCYSSRLSWWAQILLPSLVSFLLSFGISAHSTMFPYLKLNRYSRFCLMFHITQSQRLTILFVIHVNIYLSFSLLFVTILIRYV